MSELGIAIDLGTSGFRAQALDLAGGEVLVTAITARHPLPGANVMDHLNFAVEMGLAAAHDIVMEAVNQVIGQLGVPLAAVGRLAVCGNPIQLSLFEEIEIRDLAYAGDKKKRSLGITAPDRSGRRLSAGQIRNLAVDPEVAVYIPPAVKHEVGADALAMMLLSGMLDSSEICLATDYGTNAEMALKVGQEIFTGSCAAGPALEGQHIEMGMLAAPGAIADVEPEGSGWRSLVLNPELMPEKSDLVDPLTGRLFEGGGRKAGGITGTGVVAAVYEGTMGRLVHLPRVTTQDGYLHLAGGVKFGSHDLGEAGKAIGAIRAGYTVLAKEAGIEVGQIQAAYMAGASGTYVNAWKALQIGMVPPGVKAVYQIGNTSLRMAGEMVVDPARFDLLRQLAGCLQQKHVMFGLSRDFSNAYLLELSYWTEGMPWSQYANLARTFKLPVLDEPGREVGIVRVAERDIVNLGARGLVVIDQVGRPREAVFPLCTGCGRCVDECPENALDISIRGEEPYLILRPDRCNGTACLRCERKCPEKVFSFRHLSYAQ